MRGIEMSCVSTLVPQSLILCGRRASLRLPTFLSFSNPRSTIYRMKSSIIVIPITAALLAGGMAHLEFAAYPGAPNHLDLPPNPPAMPMQAGAAMGITASTKASSSVVLKLPSG